MESKNDRYLFLFNINGAQDLVPKHAEGIYHWSAKTDSFGDYLVISLNHAGFLKRWKACRNRLLIREYYPAVVVAPRICISHISVVFFSCGLRCWVCILAPQNTIYSVELTYDNNNNNNDNKTPWKYKICSVEWSIEKLPKPLSEGGGGCVIMLLPKKAVKKNTAFEITQMSSRPE